MKSFAHEHAMLVARELPSARHDAERFADMVSAMVEALCLSIAVGGQGDPAKINEFCEGVSARLFEGAAERASVATLLAGAR